MNDTAQDPNQGMNNNPMSQTTDHNSDQQPADHYMNYQPPASSTNGMSSMSDQPADYPVDQSADQPMMDSQPDMSDQPMMDSQPDMSDQPSASAPAPESSESEILERQNIFNLLGVTDGSDQEKESFLDELQQVIWEDFLENDVKLLLTTQELADLDKILKQEGVEDLQKQENVVAFLEKLIPDLEEIMLEKALELKSDLVRERISGMKDYYADNQDVQNKIQEAEDLVNQEKWLSASLVLNGIS